MPEGSLMFDLSPGFDLDGMEDRAKRCVTHHYGCDCRELMAAKGQVKALEVVDALAELVRLKRLHDAGDPAYTPEAKAAAWKRAFELVDGTTPVATEAPR